MIMTLLTVVLWCTWIVKPANASSGSNKIDVSTSCFPNHIQISLLRESFPGVNTSALHLRSPLCKPTRNSTHVTFKAPLYGCKTRVVKIDGNFTFDNVVRGISPSIQVRCFYPNKHHTGSGGKDKGKDSMTAQLIMYQDSKLSRPVRPGGIIRFDIPNPQDLFFDLKIIPKQNGRRVCLYVKFCGLFVDDKVLSLIENGKEKKMTTSFLFTSAQRMTFRFNASFLVTSMNLNTKLKAICVVNGYHDNRTQENKGCNGNRHAGNHHGNASVCQESKEGPDSTKDNGRNSSHCDCEQEGTPKANGEVNQTRKSCDESCVNGSKVNNGTSFSSQDRKLRRNRDVKNQGLNMRVVSQENNNTVQSSLNRGHNNDSNTQDPLSNKIPHETHTCSSPDWNGKPVPLLLEKEWVTKPSVPENDLKWLEKHDVEHVPRSITNGVNTTVVAQTVQSKAERLPSPALLLACSYLSLLLVIGPVLLVYLWDRRNQKKRRRHKQRTRYARGCSDARLLLTREQSVA